MIGAPPPVVGWGVLGFGAIGRHLGWVIDQAPEARLVAVGSRSGTPYEQVLADPAVDVVYIALPHHLHLEWVLAALAVGKHVLCEKPLGLSVREVDRMRAAAGASLLVEASFWRWHPRVVLAGTLLGRIGPVEHVEAGFTFGSASGWRREPASGGALWDVGCYAVSAALWAAGDVISVTARSRCADGVDLDTSLVCEHASGATSSLRAAIDGTSAQWLIVTGSAGELQIPGDPFTGGGQVWVSDGSGTERIDVAAPRDAYAEMVRAVSRAVRGQPAWLLPAAESAAVAAILDAARASAADASRPRRPAGGGRGVAPSRSRPRVLGVVEPTLRTVPDIAAALGTDVLRVRDLIGNGTLLAVRGEDGVLRVPAEFVQGGAVLKGLPGIVTLLRDGGFDDAAALGWLFAPDETLPGSPVQALLENRRTEVSRRAQALAW